MPSQIAYLTDFIDKIICGSVPDALNQIPDGVFQTCITSPPYWGLRDYGLDRIVWDGDPLCQHEWFDSERKLHSGSTASDKAISIGGAFHGDKVVTDGFCAKCGAWLGSLGLEPTPELYIDHLVQIFREVKRVLRPDGTLWLNIGDSYAGSWGAHKKHHKAIEDFAVGKGAPQYGEDDGWCPQATPYKYGLKPKDMVLIPFRLALALQTDGWWVRSDIIWHKPNVMPSSVKDRPTTDFEHVFLLAKSKKYYYDYEAILEPYTEPLNRWGGPSIKEETPKHSKYLEMQNIGASSAMRAGRQIRPNEKGKNKRTVWTIPSKSYPDAHFATFPPKLIEPMILAGSKEGDIVLDPFAGSGTTLAEAKRHGRHYIGIEAQEEYIPLIQSRIGEVEVVLAQERSQLKLDLTGGGE